MKAIRSEAETMVMGSCSMNESTKSQRITVPML